MNQKGGNRGKGGDAGSRRVMTAWRAIVWAYRDEHVRAARAEELGPDNGPGLAQSPMDRERGSGGLINGWLEPHPDALTIHRKLEAWFDHAQAAVKGRRLMRIVMAAEARNPVVPLPPPPTITLTVVRPKPVLNRDGSAAVELRRGGKGKWEPWYCPVEWEGEPADVVAARLAEYREFYVLFLAFLKMMPQFPLVRLSIEGDGIDKVTRIIDNNVH
jgi:hypothetical protein